MREILFRGKRVDNGEWVEGSLYYNRLNGKCAIQQHTCGYEVISETVGQYTGLNDKNGKKIFEGDIVNFGYTDEQRKIKLYNATGEVVYDDTQAQYKIIKSMSVMELWLAARVTVVGNIYDTPELLGDKQNDN